MWVFPKIGVPPNHPMFNRVFHYKPSILGYHYFWKHAYTWNPKMTRSFWLEFGPDLVLKVSFAPNLEDKQDPTIQSVYQNGLHPPKQTWNLKIDPWKRRFLLETIISRFHVNFWGCKYWTPKEQLSSYTNGMPWNEDFIKHNNLLRNGGRSL